MMPNSTQVIAVSSKAVRPPQPLKSPRSPRRTASSIEPVMYSGAISVVGHPNANTGSVMYPSRPSGRTPLRALTNSAVARSGGRRLTTIGAGADPGLQVAAHDLAGTASGQLV